VRSIKKIVLQELPFFMAVPAFIWQMLFFCVPLVIILLMSFTGPTAHGAGLFLTLDHFRALCEPVYYLIVLRSLIRALFTALFCLVISYPVAYFLALYVKKWKNFFLFLLIVPFWTNMLVLVYAWFFILERFGLVNNLLMMSGVTQEPLQLLYTPFAVYIGLIYCYLPFMLLPLYSILEKLDTRQIEASLDLGATPWQTFMRVTVPHSLQGIKTGFFLVFVPSFGEFVIPALLGGGKQLYVGSLISHLFLVGRNEPVGAAFTCMTGFIILVIALLVYWFITKIING